jgi:hypothetical protein
MFRAPAHKKPQVIVRRNQHMSEGNGNRVRITLNWIKLLDSLDMGDEGQFRFTAKVSSNNRGGFSEEIRFPEEGYYPLSSKPGYNFIKLDRVLWEGDVDDHLTFELLGEEIDRWSANDFLDHYSREFLGPPSEWAQKYHPMDEGADDPENMSNWRIAYTIEML